MYERGVDRDCPTWHVMIDDHGLLRTVCDTDEDIGKPDGPDATHIATFDPSTVKALIARVRVAELCLAAAVQTLSNISGVDEDTCRAAMTQKDDK